MSALSDSFYLPNSNIGQNQYYDNYSCDNHVFTDYPSPMSSPNSPDYSDFSEGSRFNGTPLYTNTCDYCASPCSTTCNDDIDIDIDLNTTSKGSYTNLNSYTKNANFDNSSFYVPSSPSSLCQSETSTRTSRKRSFSEVDDTDVFSNIDSMSDEEIDNYLNNLDLDLLPKVKSSSELLIFSPLAMKRYKLSSKKSTMESSNNCIDTDDNINSPRIVEISDDEEINQNSSNSISLNNENGMSNSFYDCSSPYHQSTYFNKSSFKV